jgi:hypothetical protein
MSRKIRNNKIATRMKATRLLPKITKEKNLNFVPTRNKNQKRKLGGIFPFDTLYCFSLFTTLD